MREPTPRPACVFQTLYCCLQSLRRARRRQVAARSKGEQGTRFCGSLLPLLLTLEKKSFLREGGTPSLPLGGGLALLILLIREFPNSAPEGLGGSALN